MHAIISGLGLTPSLPTVTGGVVSGARGLFIGTGYGGAGVLGRMWVNSGQTSNSGDVLTLIFSQVAGTASGVVVGIATGALTAYLFGTGIAPAVLAAFFSYYVGSVVSELAVALALTCVLGVDRGVSWMRQES